MQKTLSDISSVFEVPLWLSSFRGVDKINRLLVKLLGRCNWIVHFPSLAPMSEIIIIIIIVYGQECDSKAEGIEYRRCISLIGKKNHFWFYFAVCIIKSLSLSPSIIHTMSGEGGRQDSHGCNALNKQPWEWGRKKAIIINKETEIASQLTRVYSEGERTLIWLFSDIR